jgi:hypothetical protein
MQVSARFFGVLLVAGIVLSLSEPSLLAQELSPPGAQWEYHLGHGLRIGDSGLTLGGYGSVRYEALHERPQEFAASALSLFISWDSGARVRLFSELELEDFAVAREGRKFGSRSAPFEAERLYADTYFSDMAIVRLGKFLTPIGRWNLIHADPLVWTTSRPLVTFQSFSSDATGGMLYGTVSPLGKDLEYSLYAEVTDELNPDPHEKPFTEAAGLHLVSHLTDSTELGLSYANFKREEERNEDHNLLGADFLWTQKGFELTGEFVYRLGERRPDSDEWGIFAQGVVPLSARFFAIGRYEFFDPEGPLPGVHLWVGGLAFRPLSPLLLKAEYSVGHDNRAGVAEGFATSVSILF